jgi:hypothetical protein
MSPEKKVVKCCMTTAGLSPVPARTSSESLVSCVLSGRREGGRARGCHQRERAWRRLGGNARELSRLVRIEPAHGLAQDGAEEGLAKALDLHAPWACE